jgi:hypothetical protein
MLSDKNTTFNVHWQTTILCGNGTPLKANGMFLPIL